MTKRSWRRRSISIVISLSFSLFLSFAVCAEEMGAVLKIADGDTIIIDYNSRRETIELIGIDAPESTMNRKAVTEARCAGESLLDIASKGIDAKRFVERIVKKGDVVALSFDGQGRNDEGRLQGYVYLPDGRMLNEEIVRAGFAKATTTGPHGRYRERFLEAQKEARMYRRGLWKSP